MLVGALLGGSVGLAQWRACVVGRLNAVHFSPWPAAFGVGAGLAVGEMSSLGNERVRRLRAEVIPLADSLLADARAYHPPTPQIERAHGPAVATLEAAQESLSWLATALATGDADLLTRAQGRWREHDQAFERWPAAVAELPLDK